MIEQLQQLYKGTHLARELEFNELTTQLFAGVDKGTVHLKQMDGLSLFTYSKTCAFDRDNWNFGTLLARGLILDLKNKQVVATPFPKFFNYQEVPYVPNEPFSVLEKLEGSLIIIYNHRGKWCTATKGSFVSDQAKWAQEILDRKIRTQYLVPGVTYLAEAVYSENKIVVPYEKEGLYLLAAYDTDGKEFRWEDLQDLAHYAWFLLPKKYDYPIDRLLEIAKTMKADEGEGFVIVFKSGYRIKIKGDDYCRVHKLISQCTPLGVWECYLNLDNLDEIKRQLPENFQTDLDNIYQLLKEEFNAYLTILKTLYEDTLYLSDKDLGLQMPQYLKKFGDIASLIFACRKKNFLNNIFIKPDKAISARRTFFNLFRPTGNVLGGYKPSSSMQKFNSENDDYTSPTLE